MRFWAKIHYLRLKDLKKQITNSLYFNLINTNANKKALCKKLRLFLELFIVCGVMFGVICSNVAYGATKAKSQRYIKQKKSTKTQNPQNDSAKTQSAKTTQTKEKESKKDSKESKEESQENLIDYSTLSLYYYPYIMAYHKISDKEIASLIKNLDLASKKSGVFVGVYGGWIFHNATGNKNYNVDNFLAYGAKIGYQSFYPTMFESLSYPNKVGGRIYLLYLGSNAKELNLSSLGFSSIGISGDLMIDLPVPLTKGGLEAGVILGFGLASMIYDSNSDSTLGGVINIGTSFTLLSKHRIEGEIKLIINERLNWFGVMPMVGYSYVF